MHHVYELDGTDETKFIGVYSSRDSAKLAVARLVGLPGFCDHPDDFHVEAYRVVTVQPEARQRAWGVGVAA